MIMSRHGNACRVSGPLWGKSIGHRWIPIHSNSAGLWDFLCLNKLLNKQSNCRLFETQWHVMSLTWYLYLCPRVCLCVGSKPCLGRHIIYLVPVVYRFNLAIILSVDKIQKSRVWYHYWYYFAIYYVPVHYKPLHWRLSDASSFQDEWLARDME